MAELSTAIKEALVALAGGITAHSRPVDSTLETLADRLRDYLGGDLAPQSTTQLRWYPRDVETALTMADQGDLLQAAKLWSACQHDGVILGVLGTRTDGLVRLPKIFAGNQKQIATLAAGQQSVGSTFDLMCPPRELAKLARQGIGLGVGIGELVPVPGRRFPLLQTIEPEFLRYKPWEGRWYYLSRAGEIPVVPGNGRWVLHQPGGAINPWRSGVAFAVGEAWIHKTHARSYDNNWQSKLANPARVAYAPQGATEEQRASHLRALLAWGINTVIGMPVGYDAKLLESNGRGSESFDRTIKRSERECIIAIAGQEVTTDGGSGFQNNDIHAQIRADLIQATASELALTINTQVIPAWVCANYGIGAVFDDPVSVWWDVTPPGDRTAMANLLTSLGNGVKQLNEVLASYGERLDLDVVKERFGLVTAGLSGDIANDTRFNPLDLVKDEQRAAVIRVNSFLEMLGLPPDDELGELTIAQAVALAEKLAVAEPEPEPETTDDDESEGVAA